MTLSGASIAAMGVVLWKGDCRIRGTLDRRGEALSTWVGLTAAGAFQNSKPGSLHETPWVTRTFQCLDTYSCFPSHILHRNQFV